jgi:hypothetical protein
MSLEFKLEEFIPYYVDYNDETSIYNLPEGDELYYSTLFKKEFDDLRLDKVDEIKPGELFKQQVFISRFISSYTPYDKMLVYHGIGTGKTCVITAVVENALKTYPNFRPAIVLTRNPTLKNDIIGKIAGDCTTNKYQPTDIYIDENDGKLRDKITKRVIDERTVRKRIQKNIKYAYQVYTFSMFAKEIKHMSDSMLKTEYNNRVIIIDEAHNIKDKAKTVEGNISVYKTLHNFLHVVQGCKILLLTATPMKDQPSEIINVLNLLLPLDKQIDKKDFMLTYIKPTGFDRDLAKTFKDKYLRGMISYVRSMTENIKVINEGSIDKEAKLNFIKTTRLPMDDFQENVYREEYKKDNKLFGKLDLEEEIVVDEDDEKSKSNTLWLRSRQSSMFVFPDGSYGTEGEKKYLITKGNSITVTSELEKFIKKKGNDNKNKLKQLKILSCKFAKIIKDIIDRPSEKFFIYSNIVTGGGAHLFSAILQLFDFNHIDIPTKSVKVNINNISKDNNRFVLVTGGGLTAAQTDLLIDGVFNDKQNIYGDYLRIIIGSHVVGEGKSFKHVKNMYVLTPGWNTPTIDQAVGRVVRATSHVDFENPADRFVRVYRLAAIPSEDISEDEENLESIDIMMYKISEDKDIKIKSIERLLKESAIDCALNYRRNVSEKDEPNSKECDYMSDCKYTCDYIDSKYYEKAWIGDRITDTYNLYYAYQELDKVKVAVKDAFRRKNAYDFFELYSLIKNEIKDIPPLVLARALNDMILYNDAVRNRYNFVNFIREDRNLYFLVDDPLSSTLYTSYYYALNPIPESKFDSFDEIIKYQQLINFDDVLDILVENQSNSELITKILENLPQHLIEKLLQIFLFAKIKKSETNKELQNQIINKYGKFIIEYPQSYIINIDKDNLKKLSKKAESYTDWEELTEQEMIKMKEQSKEKISELKQNPYGYYALIGNTHQGKDSYKNLRIVAVREVRLTQKGEVNKSVESSMRGQTCGEGEFKLNGLITFYYDILKKSEKLETVPPKVPIKEDYEAKEIIKMDKFNKFLRDHIIRELEDNEVIEKIINDDPVQIKQLFINILEKGDKKDKKIIPTVNSKDVFTYNTLKNILGMMGKTRETLVEELLEKPYTGYEEEEINEKILEDLESLDEVNLSRLGNALSMKAPDLCPIIEEWFKKNGLYENK